MTPSEQFSSGIVLAPFVTSSGLLCRSWDVILSRHAGIISNVGVGLTWKVYKEPRSDLTIIAFEATPDSPDLQADLVSSNYLRKQNLLHFAFLSSRSNPIFTLNFTAVSLFRENHQQLDQLKSEIKSSTPMTRLIVTGHGLGASVASLFTLSLLDSIGSEWYPPLCITFGSPLVGDKNLQEAISRNSYWNSCFLHVVSHRDPLPRLFITNPTGAYMPFGTFLLCSEAHSTCFDNPDSTLEILVVWGSTHVQNQGFQSADYGNIVENLRLIAISKDFSTQPEYMTHPDSLASCVRLQLRALELTSHIQQQQQNIDINILETKIKKREKISIIQKRKLFKPYRILSQMKTYMAQLEWYKKETKSQGIGYYDSYRNMNHPWDLETSEFHKRLTIYWESMVEEGGMKPQREVAAFRDGWLSAGTSYRRMVEPLGIAELYREGRNGYVSRERSTHFIQLEQWLMEGTTEARRRYLDGTSRRRVEAILTVDSCFWSHVEEALLLCKQLRDVQSREIERSDATTKLLAFEMYVYGLLVKYAVSPEIFLAQSSYMRWWHEYRAIKGPLYNSPLGNFMNDAVKREQYAVGAYDFP